MLCSEVLDSVMENGRVTDTQRQEEKPLAALNCKNPFWYSDPWHVASSVCSEGAG